MGMVVKLNNGEKYELPESGLSDAVAFERHFGKPSAILGTVDDPSGKLDAAGEPVQVAHPEQRLEHLLFMVYRGLLRLGVIPKGKPMDDDFLDSVQEIDVTAEPGGGEEEADPTGAPARPRGRSRS